jgi:hypothetical protein
MGKRKEPRKDLKVPVRIFGTDSSGQIFSEKVFTVNVSRSGVEVTGVQAQLRAEDIIGITYGPNKAHFRIKWVGQPNTPKATRLGLLNLSPEKAFWDFPLPGAAESDTWRDARDRRAHPRLKCVNSVELYPSEQASPLRARSLDLSIGGCFVEMPNPLPKGTRLKIGLWLKETKLWTQGRVVTSTPGFGIGVQFTDISEPDKEQLRKYLQSMSRLPI